MLFKSILQEFLPMLKPYGRKVIATTLYVHDQDSVPTGWTCGQVIMNHVLLH